MAERGKIFLTCAAKIARAIVAALFAICLALPPLIPKVAFAAPGDLLFKLTAPDAAPGTGFGSVLATVDGDILVGEPTRDLGFPFNARGRAYLFDGRTGTLKGTFDNPEPTDLDVFSRAAAGGDGRVFLATSGVVPRVYAFDTRTGNLLNTYREPDGQDDNFGSDVAYGHGSVLISSPSFTVNGQIAVGRAHLFDAASGELQHRLLNPEPKAGDAFGGGKSLLVLGTKAVVGAVSDDLPDDLRPDGDNPGRVWLFDRSTGQSVLTLENPNADKPPPLFLSDVFGWIVAGNEEFIVVGAHEDDTAGPMGSGSAYVFDTKKRRT